MKPFLKSLAFQELSFAKDYPKCFQVLGFDILIDKKGKPWLLEINSKPSMSVDFCSNEYLGKGKGGSEKVVSPVDLYVKSLVIGDAVRLGIKDIQDIYDYEEYGSYVKVYDDEIEQELEGSNILDDLFLIYRHLFGSKYLRTLSQTKFSKIHLLLNGFKNKTFSRTFADLVFTQIKKNHQEFDFFAFVDSIEEICKTFYGKSNLSLLNKYEEIIRFMKSRIRKI